MPVYLNALEIGTADDVVGFPHGLPCMGVVAMTGNALFGLHLDATTPATRDGACRALHGFMLARQAGPVVALYGSCNHAKRYPDTANRIAAWQAEMQVLAGCLGGWHGPARGFNTAFIEPRPGTFIVYRPDFAAARCQIHYKRNEPIDDARGGHAPAAGADPDIARYDPGRDAPIDLRSAATTAAIRQIWSDRGQLH
jgi:hypothetical protein